MNLGRVKRAWGSPAGQGATVALVTALAALLRFAAIGRWPPGLYHDEAYNGLDALRVLQIMQSTSWPASLAHLPLFFEANNGREPLFIYLLALSVRVWGRSPVALRLVAAALGTLTIPTIYWLGREWYGHAVGLVAAALATTTVWTLNLSRVAFRAVSMVPLLALALALLWRGNRLRRRGVLALAGLAYGLSFYTYLAARLSVVALFLFIIYMLLWHRGQFWAQGWALFGLVALLVVLPLAAYAVTHWEATLGRAGQVSLLNPDIHGGNLPVALARHLWRTAGGFFWRGDFIPRHNVPLRPVFAPLMAVAFLGGVIIGVRRVRQPASALGLIWLAVMLVPTVLAEDAPHFLRGSGVLPVLFCFPALGLVGFARLTLLGRRWLAPALVGLALILSAGQDVLAYARHVRSEAAYYQFETAAVELAAVINRFRGVGWSGEAKAVSDLAENSRQVYIAPRLWEGWPTVRFLCPEGEDLAPLDSSTSPDGPTATHVMLALWPFDDHTEALERLPEGSLVRVREGARERGDLEAESRLLYVTYYGEPAGNLAEREPLAVWENGVRLLDHRLERLPNDEVAVILTWQATEPVGADLSVFCHLLSGGAPVAQADGPAAQGYYSTSRWRAGDVVEDRHVARLSDMAGDGSLCVRVGLYRWETMDRIAIENGASPTDSTYVEFCE